MAVAGGSAIITFGLSVISTGGAVAGGQALAEFVSSVQTHVPVGGAVAGGAALFSVALNYVSSGGAVTGGAAVIEFHGAPPVHIAAGGSVAGGAADIKAFFSVAPITNPPVDWQDDTTPVPPGPSGLLPDLAAPLLPAHQSLTPIYALTTYIITLNLQDITGQVQRCTIDESENQAFGTCTIEIPVGMEIKQNDAMSVTVDGVPRLYRVEDITPTGPARSVWCRSIAASIDEPHVAESSWNSWDTPYTTAAQLATALAGTIPLTWLLPDWALPNRWELTGYPIEALQQLVASVGGLIVSNPDGSLTVRRKWPVRPPDMAAATPVTTINRDVALEDSPITAKLTPGKGYGSVTVYGYDPSSSLPDIQVEESSPVLAKPVHVRLFWPYISPPPFSSFITDGTATKLGSYDYLVEDEEVIFTDGTASTRYPIKRLYGVEWIGANRGEIWWLENGSSKEISTIAPNARGIAKITYGTRYERWQLTGQTANKCLFGVDVGRGQVSAVVTYSSGGSVAPALTASLANDTGACIEAGTAFLDGSRAYVSATAQLPLMAGYPGVGDIALFYDPVTGLDGNGKIASSRIVLEPAKTTQDLEVHLPC